MKKTLHIIFILLIFVLSAVLFSNIRKMKKPMTQNNTSLSPAQYAVLKQNGTETPYSSPLLDEKRPGTYVTADCMEPVFRSEQKFDSGTGWPSFYAPINPDSVVEVDDSTMGITRTEIRSKKCNSHLGHVFNDAPQTPTGLRYCINGIALIFIPDKIE